MIIESFARSMPDINSNCSTYVFPLTHCQPVRQETPGERAHHKRAHPVDAASPDAEIKRALLTESVMSAAGLLDGGERESKPVYDYDYDQRSAFGPTSFLCFEYRSSIRLSRNCFDARSPVAEDGQIWLQARRSGAPSRCSAKLIVPLARATMTETAVRTICSRKIAMTIILGIKALVLVRDTMI